ncbi:cytochrome P450 [Actinomadura madurae]|uniref:cytochrome P450 n=1 Tax=Actinomadura madurae TaxID=1993 RepID=UPI00399C07AF
MTETRKCPIHDLEALTTSPTMAADYLALRSEAEGATVLSGKKLADTAYWAIIDYDLIRKAAVDTTAFPSGPGITIPPLRTPIPLIPAEKDPPDHIGYRKLLVPELRPERMASWADFIRRSVDHEIDQFIEAGEGDLGAVGRFVPPAAMSAILGVPDDARRLAEITDRLNETATVGDKEGRDKANLELLQYADALVTLAEQDGGERGDLVARVSNATIKGEPIGHRNAVGMVITLIIGGLETTVNGISSMLVLVARHPEVRARLLADASLIPLVVEESLRIESPVQMIARTIASDMDLGGCPVKAGDKVGFSLGAAHFDAEKFEEPDVFNIDRTSSVPHLAFGHGIHRCVGEHLARSEMIISLEQVLKRMPDYEITAEIKPRATIAFNRGVGRVPVKFTPGARVLS